MRASRQTLQKKSQPVPASRKKIPIPRFRALTALICIVLALLVGSLVLTSRAGSATYTWNPATGAQAGRLFSADSPLNQAIPADVQYRADGQTRIQAAGPPANLSQLTWSVPVFDVDGSSPKVKVFCYVYTCDEITNTLVPIPNGVYGQQGSDGHVTIIDHSTRKVYDYWIWKDCSWVVNFVNANYCPASAGIASLDGYGVGGGTNVAGLAGGMIRTYEVEAGVIDHALTFATGTTCQGVPFYPALYSDGVTINQSTCMPIGSRIQLDPTVNVDALPGITAFEKMVAKALQKYGAYANDTSLTFGFGMEFDRTGRNVYTRAGLPAGDYSSMTHIPWDRIKMIQPQWNTDGTKAYSWGNTASTVPPVAPVPIAPAPTGPGTNGTSAAANSTPTSRTVTPTNPKAAQPSTSGSSGTGEAAQASPSATPTATPSFNDSVDLKSRRTAGSQKAAISSSVVGSFLFINRSVVSWQPVEGAVKYRVRVNSGFDRTTTTTSTTIWHLATGQQKIFIQPLKADGRNAGDAIQLTISTTCTWYGVCK